jgi:hypothetical protein
LYAGAQPTGEQQPVGVILLPGDNPVVPSPEGDVQA